MSHIFISYSKKNRDYASALANKLRDAGFDVWIDDRIKYGDEWWEKIVEAIRDCAAFLVIMTPESDVSKWVKREVTLADHLFKPIFPVLLDGDLINSKNWTLFIGTEYVDVRNGDLPNDDFYTWLQTVVQPKMGGRGEENSLPLVSSNPTPKASSAVTRRAAPAARTKDARQFPIIIKPNWVGKIIPEPFEWCVVPAGKVTLEPHGYRTGYLKFPLTFEVPEFEISRFPITNAQFDAFVSSEDGWCDRSWWDFSQNAKVWREENDTPAPGRLAECGNCPRTNLSWYSAIAFALWLSAKTGEDVMLPNEQQWQRAAQGDDGRIYPWGDKWDGNLCNHSVAPYTSQNTSTVTHYYEGASPFGVLDMSGNVWEWCLTDINTGNVQLAGANFRVLRGGAFYVNDLEYIQTTVRNGNIPSSQNEVSGFRLVRFP